MSANNAVFVAHRSGLWHVWEGDTEQIVVPKNAETYHARADALMAAHDLANSLTVVEYGVIELEPTP